MNRTPACVTDAKDIGGEVLAQLHTLTHWRTGSQRRPSKVSYLQYSRFETMMSEIILNRTFNYSTDTNYSDAINLIRYSWGGADMVLVQQQWWPLTSSTPTLLCNWWPLTYTAQSKYACTNHTLAGKAAEFLGKEANIREQVSMDTLLCVPLS